MKKAFILVLMVGLAIALAAPVYAEHYDKGPSHEGAYQCPLTDKLMMKAKFMLENKDEIGLTDEQVKKIKEIKHSAKKAYIRQSADMEILHIDIEDMMSEPKVDVQGIDTLIDQGSASMTASMKKAVQSYADLKAVLTDEQMTKLKEIWKKKKD